MFSLCRHVFVVTRSKTFGDILKRHFLPKIGIFGRKSAKKSGKV